MKEYKPLRRYIIPLSIFLLLALLCVAFIFSNSAKGKADSTAQSDSLIEILKPIFDPHNQVSADRFSYVVRKVAHGLEFCALALCLSGVLLSLPGRIRWTRLSLLLAISLCVAVMDELIQSFSDRSPMVGDVMIDLGGAVVGIGLAALLRTILTHRRKAKRKSF